MSTTGTQQKQMVTADITPEERALMLNDLSALKPEQRASLYVRVCESVGLNHLTQPFQYLQLNGKLVLYASRNCTDQLRKINGVSLEISGRERMGDIYTVTARARTPDGRTDESLGAVVIGHLKGDALANAIMKCETKSKRRVTLSICGLSFLDESELDTIKDARPLDEHAAQPEQLAPPSPEGSTSPEKVAQRKVEAKSYLNEMRERFKAPPEESNDEMAEISPGDYVVKFNSPSMRGMALRDISLKDLEEALEWIATRARRPLATSLIEFQEYARAWISEQTRDDGPPINTEPTAPPSGAMPDPEWFEQG